VGTARAEFDLEIVPMKRPWWRKVLGFFFTAALETPTDSDQVSDLVLRRRSSGEVLLDQKAVKVDVVALMRRDWRELDVAPFSDRWL